MGLKPHAALCLRTMDRMGIIGGIPVPNPLTMTWKKGMEEPETRF